MRSKEASSRALPHSCSGISSRSDVSRSLSANGSTRCHAEASEAHLIARAVHQDMGRPDILVDEAVLVSLAQKRHDADGEAQEASDLHWHAGQAIERLAVKVLEHQYGAAAFAPQLERPRRPGPLEPVPQLVLVGEAIEAGRWRTFRRRQHGRHGAAVAVSAQALSSAEDALAVLPHDQEVIIFLNAEPKRLVPIAALRQQAGYRLSG
jgi:hypothetical protein